MSIKNFSYISCITILAIAMMLTGVWCLTAIWYERGIDEPIRPFLIAALAILLCILVGGLATNRPWIALSLYCLLLAAFIGWWAALVPSNDRKWAPDVARNLTATIDGDHVEIANLRNFTWRTVTDFDQNLGETDLPTVASQ